MLLFIKVPVRGKSNQSEIKKKKQMHHKNRSLVEAKPQNCLSGSLTGETNGKIDFFLAVST